MTGEGPPPLVRCDAAMYRLERALNLLAGIAVGTLILLANIQILGRKLFNYPLPGFIDWIEQAMAVIAFIGLAYCQREGAHMRMGILIERITGRPRLAIEAAMLLLSALVAAVLVWGSWLHFERAFDWSSPMYSRDSTMDIGLPLWPAKLLVPISFTLLLARMLLQLWDFCRAFAGGGEPVILPPEQGQSLGE